MNHYIPHAYSMCLPEVFRGDADEHRNGGGFTPPGYCMSYLAPAFYAGGFNPQYGIFCKLMRYAQRACHLLAGANIWPMSQSITTRRATGSIRGP